ncbi:MAG: R3H domain-containing nucleic acid-binding protein [Candidatus Paceibacterota bacterium]
MKNEEIQNLIKDLIEKTTVSVKEITFTEQESTDRPGMTMFSVEVGDPYHFLGRGGEGLAALNHLVRRIVESKVSPKPGLGDEPKSYLGSILVDINGFQKKRIESIHAVAHMMAERARYFKSSIEVDPMSAFDRRIVHEFLANETDLKTESTGEGLSRRVVIKYVGNI